MLCNPRRGRGAFLSSGCGIVGLAMSCLASLTGLDRARAADNASPPSVRITAKSAAPIVPVLEPRDPLYNDRDFLGKKNTVRQTDDRAAGDFDPYPLMIGDRMSIVFINRDDISGEYVIRADGSLRLPTIGRFRAAGLKLNQLEEQMQARFQEQMGRTNPMRVEVVKRRPVFLVGDVKQPGSLPFIPGMNVIQAVAISGGLFRDAAAGGGTVEFLRENARFDRVTETLKRGLVRLARLEAERIKHDEIKPSAKLLKLVGASEAASLIEAENVVLADQRQRHLQQVENLRKSVKFTEIEIKALESSLRSAKSHNKNLQTEVGEIVKLLNKRLTSRTRLFRLKGELSTSDSELDRRRAEIARAQKALQIAQNRLQDVDGAAQQKLNQDIERARAETSRLQADLLNSKEVLRQMLAGAAPNTQKIAVNYRILRMVGGKNQYTKASETTYVMPGDVLRVSFTYADRNTGVQVAPAASRPVLEKMKPKARTGTSGSAPVIAPAGSDRNAIRKSSATRLPPSMSKLDREAKAVLPDTGKRTIKLPAIAKQTANEGDADVRREVNTAMLTKLVQRRLAQAGCLKSPVDGHWGPETVKAMKRFNNSSGNDLPTSVATLKSWSILRTLDARCK